MNSKKIIFYTFSPLKTIFITQKTTINLILGHNCSDFVESLVFDGFIKMFVLVSSLWEINPLISFYPQGVCLLQFSFPITTVGIYLQCNRRQNYDAVFLTCWGVFEYFQASVCRKSFVFQEGGNNRHSKNKSMDVITVFDPALDNRRNVTQMFDSYLSKT